MRAATVDNETTRFTVVLASILIGIALAGCGLQDQSLVEQYRQGLVGEEDVKMEYEKGASMQTHSGALGDDGQQGSSASTRSKMGLLTADIVVSTSYALVHHAKALHAVVHTPPTRVDGDRAVWEATDDGLFMRLGVERKETPKGFRYRFRLKARQAQNQGANLRTIYGGWVVRFGEESHDHDNPGFGVVRYFFDNLKKLRPKTNYSGTTRVAFRRVGDVHQVVVKALDVSTPEDPDFPPLAKYSYTLLPDGAGSLRWFSKGDFNNDGAKPLENIAMHSGWRADHSGASAGVAMDGTLDHDYISVAECWDDRLYKTYGHLGWPDGDAEDGERSACRRDPDELDAPEFKSSMKDTDPKIPGEHPAENGS